MVYLTEPKQNDPRQIDRHISAPTNLQYESRGLTIGNKIIYQKIWKDGNKKIQGKIHMLLFYEMKSQKRNNT